MNIILCDDEPLFLSSLEQKIGQWAQKNGRVNNILISKFTSSEDMLDAWEHGMQIDALFLDIQIERSILSMQDYQNAERISTFRSSCFMIL